jgi:hypothetical protein
VVKIRAKLLAIIFVDPKGVRIVARALRTIASIVSTNLLLGGQSST